MLDEGNMEKKPISRHSPVPVKTSTGDKKTDNARFQRTPRRKENGVRSYQDANPNKKPFPKKARTASDKRPRPRGYFNDKQRDEVANEILVEYNSSVSRKDLNQMINFDYGFHRSSTSSYCGTLPFRPRRYHFKSGYAAGGVFNKQQYLQANCQFVMKDSCDYSIHVIDPDQPVEWDSIEQVCMSTPDLPLCPICLSPPVAGKITKCGHIYCWSCILHYLALSEKNWHKCPICNEAVHQKDLKSVKTIEVHRYKVGDMIKLNLMRRDKGNTISVARADWNGLPSKPFNVKENHMACYSKVVTATPADVHVLVTEPETEQLLKQLDEAEESEKCFIESALLQQKDRTLLQSSSPTHKVQEQDQLSSELESLTLTKSNLDTLTSLKTSKYYANAFDEEAGSAPIACLVDDPGFNYSLDTTAAEKEQELACIAAASPTPLTDSCGPTDQELMPTEQAAQCLELPHDLGDEEAGRKRRPKCSPKNTFYFYQAADGQHIYMHAINARCMVQEYGSLVNCPDAIEATIVELESVTMTEELRKRLRYLSHLPLSAEFKVAELLLKPPLVSKETLKCFSDEIEKRRRIRQKKNREERSRSKRIQEEENRKYGISPVKIVMSSAAEIKSQASLPGLSIPVVPSYTPHPVTAIDIISPSTSGDSPIASPSSAASSYTSDGNQTTSFAQMLKSGKVRPSVASAQASGSLKPDSALRGHSVRASDSDISDNEDKIPVPNFQNSFGDAIQTALDNLEQKNTGTSAAALGGKKKKKMKKLLFTTTMARGK